MRCEICGACLKDENSFRRHIRKFHSHLSNKEVVAKMVCRTCQSRFFTNKEFERHVESDHGVQLVHETKSFLTIDEFESWLRLVERNDKAKFVRTAKTNVATKSVHYYRCNRSGPPRICAPENRKRKPKSKGTCKTNYHCTARITASVFHNGAYHAKICKTHFGHECEPEYLPFPSQKNRELATKVPCEDFLGNVPPDCSGKTEFERNHHITPQYLENIIKEFSLDQKSALDSDDSLDLDSWVEKERALSDDSCVLLYKPKGLHSVHPGIKVADFLFGIMTKCQEEILKKYGENGLVCIDATRDAKYCGCELTTVIVLDDTMQGFPVAFFISNRPDCAGIRAFLNSIKERTGIINAKTFMSDMEETFFIAWTSVMGTCVHRLYCPWSVTQAWREKSQATIKCKIKRKEVCDRVNSLLTETDEETFNILFPSIVNSLCSDFETQDFGLYFRDNYLKNCMHWAFSHYKYAGINTNINLDRLHGAVEYIYLNGKEAKRLDVVLHALTRLINRKIFDRLIVLDKGIFAQMVRELKKRHKTALSLSMDRIPLSTQSSNSWTVFSPWSNESYTVTLVDPSCSCAILCTHCKACIHKFSCTCIDFCFKSNMCQHIHLLCQFLIASNVNLEESLAQAESTLEITMDPEELGLGIDDRDSSEPSDLIDSLLLPGNDDSAKKRSEEVKKMVQESFNSIISRIKTDQEMLEFGKLIDGFIPVLEAMRN